MASFAEIKKNNKARSQALRKKLDSDNFAFPRDEKIWTPTIGDDGTGSAVIRFLPEVEGEHAPYVRRWTHFFKGPTGKVYNELSLTTIGKGEDDPVAELNQVMWATEDEEVRKVVRERSRNLQHFANIYVVKDPANPDNEGKVFIYRFGKKIRDIIEEALTPEDDDQVPIDAFNLWGFPDGLSRGERKQWVEDNGPPGANFKLRIVRQGGFPNYDRSFFEEPSTFGDYDDEQLAEIHAQCYPLQPYVDESLFKDHETLKSNLESVLGVSFEDALAEYGGVKPSQKISRKKPSTPRKEDDTVTSSTDDVDEELDLDGDGENFDDIEKLLED